MKDIAKTIVEYWRERNNIIVVEETGQVLIYKKGIFVPFPDTWIKFLINAYLDDPLESEKDDEDYLDVKFTTTLLHQVKNRLHNRIVKLNTLPHIENEYGASPNQELRSIGGISRGAGWALRIGLQHPELFTAIGLHSPAVLVPDIFVLPDWVEAIPIEAMPEIWIDIGDRDPLRFSLPELTDLFNEADVPYVFRSYPGEHVEAYWADHIEDYVRWYVTGWLDLELGDQPQ